MQLKKTQHNIRYDRYNFIVVLVGGVKKLVPPFSLGSKANSPPHHYVAAAFTNVYDFLFRLISVERVYICGVEVDKK